MPVRKINGCYKYGSSGKKYCGKNARAKAVKQGQAIELSKMRRKKK